MGACDSSFMLRFHFVVPSYRESIAGFATQGMGLETGRWGSGVGFLSSTGSERKKKKHRQSLSRSGDHWLILSGAFVRLFNRSVACGILLYTAKYI